MSLVNVRYRLWCCSRNAKGNNSTFCLLAAISKLGRITSPEGDSLFLIVLFSTRNEVAVDTLQSFESHPACSECVKVSKWPADVPVVPSMLSEFFAAENLPFEMERNVRFFVGNSCLRQHSDCKGQYPLRNAGQIPAFELTFIWRYLQPSRVQVPRKKSLQTGILFYKQRNCSTIKNAQVSKVTSR